MGVLGSCSEATAIIITVVIATVPVIVLENEILDVVMETALTARHTTATAMVDGIMDMDISMDASAAVMVVRRVNVAGIDF